MDSRFVSETRHCQMLVPIRPSKGDECPYVLHKSLVEPLDEPVGLWVIKAREKRFYPGVSAQLVDQVAYQ